MHLILGLMTLNASAMNYKVNPLIADLLGIAPHRDPRLINPWGLFFVPSGNLWVVNNGTNLASFYKPDGTILNESIFIPSHPTGGKLNPICQFCLTNDFNQQGPANFLFTTEEGTIFGFNESLDPENAILAVDNSGTNAVYKGLELGTTCAECCENTLLFAADFHNAKVDAFDPAFKSQGFIKDYSLQQGFAPFNVRFFNNLLYVAYAKQLPPDNVDDDPGPGNGFIDIFQPSGMFLKRLISQGDLNSPWGMAFAPNNFGEFSGALLVGNFGDGKINAYDPDTGASLGQLKDDMGNPIVINGLWSLEFDSGGTLYFSSGPAFEHHGLVGTITPLP